MSEDQIALLREIRDNQREALAMQREAVQTQREHVAMYKAQFDRWMRLTRFLLPFLLVMLVVVAWPWLRYLWWWITQ